MMGRWMIETLPQLLLYIFISPLVIGLLRFYKARFQGRQGPSPFQPYWDLWKNFHRRGVIPETASWVFSAAPFIISGCYVLIGNLVPIVYLPAGSPAYGLANGLPGIPTQTDFLSIVFLVGLVNFTLALAGMDSGSPYGGMGSSREMFIHVLAEPVFILVAFALALSARTTSISGMMIAKESIFSQIANPLMILILLALVLMMLAEAGRMPFDNPSSHLELTMISKAIHLEYSGHNLALLEWAEALRLTFFLTLLVNLFLPSLLVTGDTSPWTTVLLILLYPVKLWVLVTGLAYYEETRVRLRLRGIISPGGLALVFAIFAVFLAAIDRYLLY